MPSEVEQSPSTSDTSQEHNGLDIQEKERKNMIITSKLEIKYSEIDLLNTEIKTAYHTIQELQKRITELEQHCFMSGARHNATTSHSTLSNKCLLFGDTNLQNILSSDLQDSCWIRSIFEADMDLLRNGLTKN